MDVLHSLFILIFIQIALVASQKNGDAGKDIKTMTEKACKLLNTTSALNKSQQ